MEKIIINNFRKIKETWELEFAPVTFLVGTNNSGKSSVLKALMLIDDFGSSKNHFVLKFNGNNSRNHKIDCYSNAVNRQNLSKKIFDISFSIINKNYQIDYVFYPLEDSDGIFEKGKLKAIQFTNQEDQSIFKILNIADDEYQLSIDNSFIHGKYQEDDFLENDELNDFKRFKDEIQKELVENDKTLNNLEETSTDKIYYLNVVKTLKDKLKEINKRIKNLEKKKAKDDLRFNPTFKLSEFYGSETLDRVMRRVLNKYFRDNEKNIGLVSTNREMFKISMLADNIIESLNLNISHLTPNRNTQTRLYINENGNNDIYDIIKVHSENPIDKKSKAGKFLKDWMKIFDIGEDFKIKPIEGLASLIEIKENSNWINLVDKGFGAGQIFTILLKIAIVINQIETINNQISARRLRRTSPIILIEEPETNLHPALQSKLTELFIETWKEYGIQFIIETHSEYIIRKSQLLFFDYSKNDTKITPFMRGVQYPFAIYYFDKNEGPYQMNYRNDGRFTNEFGTGFFDVNSNLIFDLP